MENEENRGLIDKKAYEDQFVVFCQFIFGALSLSLLDTKFSWSTLALEQERRRRQEEVKIKWGKAGSSNYNRLHCKY